LSQSRSHTAPILLYNDECAVCRAIAKWVRTSARIGKGEISIVVRPIGNDPEALALLNPQLDIWDAYATIHLLLPDGSMKIGGEAVAEVLRDLPNTKWFAWSFAIGPAGFRPFQIVLNVGYAILSDIRPLLGCASCGSSNAAVRLIERSIALLRAPLRGNRNSRSGRPAAATRRRPARTPTRTS
jgi:predicted DCC family thiol-disulfide oxidoreductase YuxK